MRQLFASMAIVGALGCGGEATRGEPLSQPQVDLTEHDDRFIGVWIVEQPTHDAYEATTYHFGSYGALRAGESLPGECAGHPEGGCVTGTVANCVASDRCEGTVRCAFGSSWSSEGTYTLVVAGECSDGRSRTIRLAFHPDPGGNNSGANVTVASVDGDPGWSHGDWPWVFRKCAADEAASCPLPK